MSQKHTLSKNVYYRTCEHEKILAAERIHKDNLTTE